MHKVYKYNLAIEGITTLELPKGAQLMIVHGQRQQHPQHPQRPVIWCLIDPELPTIKVAFWTIMTGQPIHDMDVQNWMYVGTFTLAEDSYVGHVFANNSQLKELQDG